MYRALARPGTSVAPGSQVTIVGTKDGTNVSITTLVAVQGVTTPGVPKQIKLNRLQTYLLQLEDGDLTGTLVTADNPIAVFSGNQNGTVVGSVADVADHMIEQMPPISTWGSDFVVVPIVPRFGSPGDRVRVLAHENGTRVKVEVNGTIEETTLSAGQSHEFDLLPASVVRTSKPSLVVQFKKEVALSEVTGPFMMLVPPVSQFSRQYLFRTPGAPFSGLTGSNRLNIVVKVGDEANLRLNGAALPATTAWTSVSNSVYRYARLTIPVGPNRIEHQEPTVGFGAWVYGQAAIPRLPLPALGEGYGYAAGQLVVDQIDPVVSVPGTTEATGPDGATVTWTATDFGVLNLQE